MGLLGRDECRRLCSPFLSSFCVWAVGLVMFMQYLPFFLFRDSPLALSMYMHSSLISIPPFALAFSFFSFDDIDPRLPRRVRDTSFRRFESS